LFLGIPFMAGFCAAAILNFHHDGGILQSILVGCTSLVLIGVFLFGLAMEGIICILMAVPIAFPLGMLGAAVAHAIQRKRFPRTQQPGATMSVLLLLLPGLMGAEHAGRFAPELIAVRTEITIVPHWHRLSAGGDDRRQWRRGHAVLHLLDRVLRRADHRLGRSSSPCIRCFSATASDA
jgi:uncharacterized membrane protein YeaQ/YmgE (transglycosylase-associated protein family)